ncbi:malto-oligosyltrehalose trehalohydrolase [Lapillicoccus sp.]|uniref:malto-oligosyltrehalose trehalohydrolase n=1 Tax=Lapillicoccus sp. TaxID=1909287 RepID=UPI00326522AA
MPDKEIRVWAPHAKRVDVDVEPRGGVTTTAPMSQVPGGWWVASTSSTQPFDYAFRVDGGQPQPDPRSPWQPRGVHGPSRTFDTGAYRWGDTGWAGPRGGQGALGAVFYEMHVGTFTSGGTFDAAISRLDHLVALGVDVVEVMPVAAFPGRWGWGYDGVDLYAVHDPYGGPAALQRFVDACHQRGLGVCLDVVYNHLGPSGNYLSGFGPYFTDEHTTPWGPAVNLDADESGEVRRFVVDNALRWLRDFHVDALRLDAVHELRDGSERHILAQLADETAALGRDLGRPLTLIAESDLNNPVVVAPTESGGLGMSAQWDDDVHHALHAALTGESQGYYADFAEAGTLVKTLRDVFFHNGRYSSFRGQKWGAPVDPAVHTGHEFMGYLQTHDQVGNRATGDRIGHTVTPGQQAIGAAIYLTSVFTPMIFMGEEWGASTPWQFFTSFEEPDLAEAVRTGRRSEFGSHGWDAEDVPDPQDPATRDRSVLDWTEVAQPDHARLLSWYAGLVAERRRYPDLVDDRLDAVGVEGDDDGRWLVVSRGALRVVANFSTEPTSVPLSEIGPGPEVVLTWDEAATRRTADALELGGHGVAIVRVG